MIKARGTSIAAFLVAAALAVSACGGDDEGSGDSARTGADPPLTTTGETGTTQEGNGTTETRERTSKTTTRERERERERDKGGGSNGSSGSGGGGNSGSSQGQQLTGRNVEKTSKTVCSNFLPTQLAKQLKEGDKSAEDIAKDYSAGYPASQRKNAYDGCLAGLKDR
jgi:hypothetical protein